MTAKLGSVPAVVISTVRSSTNFTEGIERFQWLNSCTRIHKLYITFNTVYTVFASDKFLSTFLSKCICFSVVISPLKWMQKKKKFKSVRLEMSQSIISEVFQSVLCEVAQFVSFEVCYLHAVTSVSD